MNKRILKIISYALVIASFIFIIKALVGLDIRRLGIIMTPGRLLLLLVMSSFYSTNNIFFAIAWKKLLFIFSGQEIPSKKIINLYLKSNIAKYLPGNVFHFAGRHLLVRDNSVSHAHLMLSNLSEIFLLVFTATLILTAGLVFKLIIIPEKIISLISLKYIITALITLIIIASAALIILLIKKQYRRIKAFFRVISRRNLKEILLTVILYSTMFIITGFILSIIFYMLKGDNISFYFAYHIIFVFTLSWVLGYIVPGAPGGVGIREAVIIIMLSPISDAQTSALCALILRVVTITGDIISYIMSKHHYFNYTETE